MLGGVNISIFNCVERSDPVNLLKFNNVSNYDGFIVQIDETCSILACLKDDTVLNIPNSIDGVAVTSIGFDDTDIVFSEYAEHIILPDTVEEIAPRAFYGSNVIKSISGGSLKIVGSFAFYASSIETFKTKGSTIIDYKAFEHCENLLDVTLDNVLVIEDYAFAHCSMLKEISIGDHLRSLSSYAFSNCYKLKKVIIRSDLAELDKYSFSDCYNLTDVLFRYRTISIPDTVFHACPRLKSVRYEAAYG